MTLPIIIMPERHWDADAKLALEKTLPSLKPKGYKVVCFESPSDETLEELVAGVKSTIEFTEEQYAQAQTLLKRRNIQRNLSDMNYSELKALLLQFVSSRYSNEMALWFKELPGHKQKLQLINAAISLDMAVCGIDLIKSEMEPLRSMDALLNLNKKLSAVDSLDKKRIESFKTHLLDLQKTGAGVIFVVGKFHYDTLVQAFSADNSLADVIFIHPHSSKCLDSPIDDRPLAIIDNKEQLTLIDHEIENSDDVEKFAPLLNEAVQFKVNGYQSIEPTVVSKMLSEKTGLSFDLCMRPSMHVDAYHIVGDAEKMKAIDEVLTKRGISGSFTFFKEAEAYCIPCINSTEISDAITRLNLASK
jgi:hypothetical protein